MRATFTAEAKDPAAVLDYAIDWSEWLGADTIATSTWTVPSGVTKGADSHTTTTATVWISGGRQGSSPYVITNRITTAAGRTDERSIEIPVEQR